MKLIVTGTRSLPPGRLTWLTIKLDRLTARLDKAKLTVMTRPVEGLAHEWAFRSRLTLMIYHAESDAEMVKEADAMVVIMGPKRAKDSDGLEREARRRGLKVKVIEWKGKK